MSQLKRNITALGLIVAAYLVPFLAHSAGIQVSPAGLALMTTVIQGLLVLAALFALAPERNMPNQPTTRPWLISAALAGVGFVLLSIESLVAESFGHNGASGIWEAAGMADTWNESAGTLVAVTSYFRSFVLIPLMLNIALWCLTGLVEKLSATKSLLGKAAVCVAVLVVSLNYTSFAVLYLPLYLWIAFGYANKHLRLRDGVMLGSGLWLLSMLVLTALHELAFPHNTEVLFAWLALGAVPALAALPVLRRRQ